MTSIEAKAITLHTEDDVRLGARLYTPRDKARATVLIHGATATPQRYYSAFASALAERGFGVLTYDYRGVGESRPKSLRGFPGTMTDWATKDAKAATETAMQLAEPLLLVGHSFGGQLLGLLDLPDRVRSIALVGSQLGYVGHWPLARRLTIVPFWKAIVPASVATFGHLPGFMGLGVDLPGGVATEWARWCTSPRYLLDHHPEAEPRFGAIDRQILFYSFTDDSFAPRASVSAFLDAVPRAKVIHRRFSPSMLGVGAIDHFGFFRRGIVPSLWEETFGFFEDALADRPTSLRTKTSWDIELSDIEVDLAYGRA